MIKKIIFWWLRNNLKSEEKRLEIYDILHNATVQEYSEQTVPGNIYNAFSEFLVSKKVIKDLVKQKDYKWLEMVKNGLASEFNRTVEYIETKFN